MDDITLIARATVSECSMLSPDSPVLALVSGGSDSVALLRMLADGALGPIGSLSVLHVNHRLRGGAADADTAFVEALCDRLAVACEVVRFDVASYAAAEGLNLEDAGRRVRYRFADELLDAACARASVPPEDGRIAVAHSRDDRVETFFMRAITGSGAAGLASIPYVRGRVVRPLLDCDRAAIRAWLEALGQSWRDDATNDDTTRLRALVRAEIVPVAERVNPSFRETLCRSIDLLADDDALLTQAALGHVAALAEVACGERVALECGPLLELGRPMARRTLRAALGLAFPDATRIEASHIEALVAGCEQSGFARDLPWGLRAERQYGKLTVLRSDLEPPMVTPSVLPLPGGVDLGQAGVMNAEAIEAGDTSGSACSVVVDIGDVRTFVVDAVRAGDRMRPLGMEGSRKLSDLLVDAKVPRRERQATPIVRDGDRIVWLAGVRMSDEYRVRPGTRRAMRLTWRSPGV